MKLATTARTLFVGDGMEKVDLHAAARKGGFAELPAGLVTAEALTARNASGNTPLHIAAKYGHLSQLPVELLIPDLLLVKNDAGYTPLHLAAREGSLSEVPPVSPYPGKFAVSLQQRAHAPAPSGRLRLP